MNTKVKQKAKNNFQKDFLKLMNNTVFGKTMENVGKNRNIKFVLKERKRNYLVSEPNYHTTKFFTENLLAKAMRKTQILMSKPAYLGLSILDLSKTVMYKFWCDYVKTKYGENAKEKIKKINWTNERSISRTNHERICWIKSKNI